MLFPTDPPDPMPLGYEVDPDASEALWWFVRDPGTRGYMTNTEADPGVVRDFTEVWPMRFVGADEDTDEDDVAEDPAPFRSLAAYLELHNDGAESEDAGREFAELVKAVQATGKAGTLTLSLQLKASGDGLEATVQVSCKKPKPSPTPVVLYPDGRGNVTVQPAFDFAPEVPVVDFELLERALRLVVLRNDVSLARLQEALDVDLALAQKVLEQLQERDHVGPADQYGQREVFVGLAELDAALAGLHAERAGGPSDVVDLASVPDDASDLSVVEESNVVQFSGARA